MGFAPHARRSLEQQIVHFFDYRQPAWRHCRKKRASVPDGSEREARRRPWPSATDQPPGDGGVLSKACRISWVLDEPSGRTKWVLARESVLPVASV